MYLYCTHMEQKSAKAKLLAACGRILEPIIRFLVKGGISWKEFSELSKAKFVQVATSDFGIRGRPTNASRVAILTGLDRREVRKVREATADSGGVEVRFMTKASQVLDAWHHDPDFTDARRKPKKMRLEGGPASFTELVRRFAPGIPAVAMLKQLKSSGAVGEAADGRLQPLKRYYIPQDMPDEQVMLWSSTLRDLASAIDYNFSRVTGAPSMFERRAINLRVDARAVSAFKAFLEVEGQQFLERVDDWLSKHEVSGDVTERKSMRLGAGVYQIQDRPGDT
jgi:Family of unknown function (DUF6502)